MNKITSLSTSLNKETKPNQTSLSMSSVQCDVTPREKEVDQLLDSNLVS